jgi:RNA polymerase sigma-70 factor (ECF subfamily)
MSARLALVPDEPIDEWSLARRAVAGDEAAFEQLYHAHSGRVFALCLRMSGARQAAAELTQDVFVHIWKRLGTWRGESALSTWIHRLAVNVVLSNVRTEQRRQKHEGSDDGGRIADNNDDHPRAAEASVQPKSVEDAIDLENAIAALPPGARTVFVLHDVEGYQHNEIATMTGTAEGTCRAQLHRARQLLMEALDR